MGDIEKTPQASEKTSGEIKKEPEEGADKTLKSIERCICAGFLQRGKVPPPDYRDEI